MRIVRRYSYLFLFAFGFGIFSIVYLLIANLIELRRLNFQSLSKCIDDVAKNDGPDVLWINGQQFSKQGNQLPALPPIPQKNALRKTLQLSLFTLTVDKGVGQIMFELFALIGIADVLEREPVISIPEAYNNLHTIIQPMFPLLANKFDFMDPLTPGNYSMDFNTRECCVFHDTKILKNFPLPHLTLKGFYFQSFKYFEKFQSEVIMILTPSKLSHYRAELMIPPSNRNDFKICTHIRRPTIKKRDNGLRKPSDATFTLKATDFLVDKYKKYQSENVSVFVMGNDPIWAEEVFGVKIANTNYLKSKQAVPLTSSGYQVFLTPSLNPDDDIAFSRQYCDVVLLSAPSSSFGWWIAYLSKFGSTVYYRDILENSEMIINELHPNDYFLPNWRILRIREKGEIVEN